MLKFLPEFATIAMIHLLAVMSPGPDFALVSRNSFLFTRKAGIMSAFGLALGIMIHVTYSLVGIGYIISKSVVAFSIIKYVGAAYLIWIGYKSLKAKPAKNEHETVKNVLGGMAALRMGFLTNITNPKVTLFFLALFTQVISRDTPTYVRVAYGVEMSAMTFAWFAIVAIVFSQPIVKEKFGKVQHHVEKVFGLLLIALGIKVALSRAN